MTEDKKTAPMTVLTEAFSAIGGPATGAAGAISGLAAMRGQALAQGAEVTLGTRAMPRFEVAGIGAHSLTPAQLASLANIPRGGK